MKCVKDTKEFQFHNTVVALGKFDGLHLGHQALLKEVLQYNGRVQYQHGKKGRRKDERSKRTGIKNKRTFYPNSDSS